MFQLLNRVQVIATSALFYILAASAGLSVAAGELAETAPEGSETVVAWIARALVVLAGAWQAIRRVTPVPPEDRGLLPTGRTTLSR